MEIIGEAARNISEEMKSQFNDVEWRAMSDMRNRLIHGYFGVDYEIVWDVVTNKVPELQSQMQNIIRDMAAE